LQFRLFATEQEVRS